MAHVNIHVHALHRYMYCINLISLPLTKISWPLSPNTSTLAP